MQRKPVDVGNGVVCASFGTDGSLLAVCAPHRDVGLVELTAAPVFPSERDGDAAEVRRHRTRLTEPAYAVLRMADSSGRLADDRPGWRYDGHGWSAEVDVWAAPDRPAVVQRFRVQRTAAGRLRLVFGGRLDRPGYAEITPVGPVPPAWGQSTVTARGGDLEIATSPADPSARAVVGVSVLGASPPTWSVAGGAAFLDLAWDADDTSGLELEVTVLMSTPDLVVATWPPSATGAHRSWDAPPAPGSTDVLDRVAAGAMRYTRGCTALAVDGAHCCIITDHRLLPLSWTRDAYYQAALLLCSTEASSVAVVGRHLAWLWGPGRTATGVWQRSHFASGAVKDPAYQADQQLYPLLELADYRRVTGTWPRPPGAGRRSEEAARWGELVGQVWRGLPRGPGGLLPGEENPADDPTTYPYLLSSQLLLAYVGRRLGEWEHELDVADLGLLEDAATTLASTRAAFACDGPFGSQWAYESDGHTGRRLYHDANDVPTALAPLWGLCEAGDPQWRATMRFGWSDDNPGFVPGRHAGLGSAHTPGVWPLGDAQEWVTAQTVGEHPTAAGVIAKLQLVSSDDGMLPETYDPDSGVWLSRHWFGWPGALLGLLHHTINHGAGPWSHETLSR